MLVCGLCFGVCSCCWMMCDVRCWSVVCCSVFSVSRLGVLWCLFLLLACVICPVLVGCVLLVVQVDREGGVEGSGVDAGGRGMPGNGRLCVARCPARAEERSGVEACCSRR